jgi:hypothetical protein
VERHESAEASNKAAQPAADAAVKAASVQLSGETEKSRADFIRQQRRILYSTIIAHEVLIREAERKLFDDIAKSPRQQLPRTDFGHSTQSGRGMKRPLKSSHRRPQERN